LNLLLNVDETAETQPSSTLNDNLNITDPDKEPDHNPAKRVPYDGSKKIARTKADSMATINSCNGQIRRVDLRAAFLIKSHHAAKSEFSESSDFEARVNIVIANKKIVSETRDLAGYKSELESRKTELLKAAEDEINSYDFVELNW
jgi:hypothetical protein|tara:strand:- start:78 stop:515 length:438 start_codon:yes stop_codon:yes gene_type:complete